MVKPVFILTLPLALAGCTLAPQYERPSAPVTTAWAAGENDVDGRPGVIAAELGWREAFAGEPRLQAIIALALEQNRDLRVALLNVEQARALYRIQRSNTLPQLDAVGSATRQRVPASVSTTGQTVTTTQYSATVGATRFELDLFGRLRSLNAQALERYLATEEAQRGVHLALVAEVAVQYFTERALDESLVVASQNLEAAESSYRLSQRKYDLGATSELDLRSAEAQVQAVRASLADYRRQRLQASNALTLLVGAPLPDDLPAPRPLLVQENLATLPPGLPAELLVRRPDILQAEHELRAANAYIGAARAAFFPAISLTGAAGSISPELSGLFGDGTGTWNFTPQISIPLFAGGRNRANLEWAQLAKQAEVARYERTIQAAFREVSDALIARATLGEQVAALAARVSAEQRRFDLAETRYRQGLDSYLTVLNAQQDLYSAQQALINARLFETSNLVTLYRALGGGWYETRGSLAADASSATAAGGRS